jgi:hypothetical protein
VKKRKKCKYFLPSVKEGHSSKYIVPSVNRWAFGTVFLKIKIISVECLRSGARQSNPGHLAKCILKLKKSLSSARSRALGKYIVHIGIQPLFCHTLSHFSLLSHARRRRLSPPPPLPERAAGPPSRRRRPPSCHRRPPSCRRSPFAVTSR